MYLIADGVAHVSFRGGALFLPVRSLDDRHALMEHVAERVRSEGCVQVLFDGTRWIVQAQGGTASCALCGSVRHATYRATAPGGAPLCLACAFSQRGERRRLQHEALPASGGSVGEEECAPRLLHVDAHHAASGPAA